MSFFSRLFRSKAKLMTWQEFVEYFARRIQEELDLEAKIDWGETIASSPIIVHFSEDDETSSSTYLSNHYTSYLQNPEALEAIVAANLAVIDKIQDADASVSAQQILPTIKNTIYLENARLITNTDEAEPADYFIYKPIVGDIMLLYMVDTEESMHTLNREHMKEAGIEDEDALYRTAMDNLRQRINGRVQIHHAEGWSLTQIHLDNIYDASLILLLNEVLKDDPMLPANPVFTVLARNALLVCSPSDEEALQAMANIALQAFEESAYAISTQLYQYHNGTISVFRAN
ncbi:DUF1444 domain-containing protein [Neisseria bergeri]|uniref:DUF1444 domain-containing protein n=1 Tax=Neisseria bergeri TaxID=1906581 RepID=UPI0027DF1C29|nr:DUF1444 domain-containing protein [Neisseria bergeri]